MADGCSLDALRGAFSLNAASNPAAASPQTVGSSSAAPHTAFALSEPEDAPSSTSDEARHFYDEFGMPLVLSLAVPHMRQMPKWHLRNVLALLAVSKACRASLANVITARLERVQFAGFRTMFTLVQLGEFLQDGAVHPCPVGSKDLLPYADSLLSYGEGSFCPWRGGVPLYDGWWAGCMPLYRHANRFTLAQKALIVQRPWTARMLPAEWPFRYLVRLLELDPKIQVERGLGAEILKQWRATRDLCALAERLGVPPASEMQCPPRAVR